MFSFFDYDESGYINFLEMVGGLALLSDGSPFPFEDRIVLAFRIYDYTDQSHIASQEVMSLLQQEGFMSAQLERILLEHQDNEGGFDRLSFAKLAHTNPVFVEAPLARARKRVAIALGNLAKSPKV